MMKSLGDCLAFMVILLLAVSLSSCYSNGDHRVNRPDALRSLSLSCEAGANKLASASVDTELVGQTLIYLQSFSKGNYSTELTHASSLSGPCAPFVNAALLDKFGLTDGSVYQLSDEMLVEWPVSYNMMFDRVELPPAQRPVLKSAQFADAIEVEAKDTSGGLDKRYLALLHQGQHSVVVDFTINSKKQEVTKVKPLIRSVLPLRSVSYFPAPDTASGSIFLVQESSRASVRVLRLEWWHKI